MKLSTERFGTAADGREVLMFTLANEAGMEVEVLGLGGIIRAIRVPAAGGARVDVCLGFSTLAEYERHAGFYFGAMIGRYANRIGGGCFTLGGKEYRLALNDGPNHLHGGSRGFDRYVYEHGRTEDGALALRRRSPDGEEGYPGGMDVEFTYSLTDDGRLTLGYGAVSDGDTLVNLTNHSYFNLAGDGSGDVLGHTLRLNADYYSENDENCLPTGRLLPVEDSPFDFRKEKPVGRDIALPHEQLKRGGGYDNNYVLSDTAPLKAAAVLTSPQSGIELSMFTSKPCVQLYTGNALTEAQGKAGMYRRRSGMCLEAQYRPNALDDAPPASPVLRAGERYSHQTVYQFRYAP